MCRSGSSRSRRLLNKRHEGSPAALTYLPIAVVATPNRHCSADSYTLAEPRAGASGGDPARSPRFNGLR